MLKRLLLPLLFFTAVAWAEPPGYYIRSDCASIVAPIAQSAICQQTTTASGRTAGREYIWSGAAWVDRVVFPSDPTNCSAGNYPLGIDANGNVQSCTAASGGGTILGTAAVNEVAVGTAPNTIGSSSKFTWESTAGYSKAILDDTTGSEFTFKVGGTQYWAFGTDDEFGGTNKDIYLFNTVLDKPAARINGDTNNWVFWGDNAASQTMTFATSGLNPEWTFSDGLTTISAGNLAITAHTASKCVRTDASKILGSAAEDCLTSSSAVTSITGTANQITASAGVGAVTLSIPTNPILPGNAHATAFTVDGTAGAGFMDFPAQSSNPAAPAAGTARFHSATTNGFTRFEQDNEATTNITLGRDTVIIVQNTSGSTILEGQVVYRTGVFGTVPTVSLAKADSLTTMPALGLALDDIADSAFGQVMAIGVLNDHDTTGLTATPVYVSATTAGGLTNTRPAGTTNIVQRVGSILRVSATVGTILIDMAPALLNSETGTNAATWTGTNVILGGFTASQAVFTDGSKQLLSTGTSAGLAASVSDETGTAGKVVFDTDPTLVRPVASGTPAAAGALGYGSASGTTTQYSGLTATVGGFPRVLSVQASTTDTLNCNTTSNITTQDIAFATQFTIPANTLIAGKALRFTALLQETTSGSAPTVSGKMFLGSTLVYSSSVTSPGSNRTNLSTSATFLVLGTAAAGASVNTNTANGAYTLSASPWGMLNATAQPVLVATNASKIVTFTLQCGANTAGNSFTMLGLIVEELSAS